MPQTHRLLTDDAMDVLNLPLRELEKNINPLDHNARHALIDELDALIDKAVRVRGYLDARADAGGGDQGHPRGVKMSNDLIAKVRKATGYAQFRHDINF